MTVKDIYAIRDRSDSWKAHRADSTKMTPWKTDEVEMMKKTLLKRGSKGWPRSAATERLARAVDAMDTAEGVDFTTPETLPEGPDPRRETGLQIIREYLEVLDREEAAFIEHAARTCNREIGSLDDLTMLEIDQQVTFLEGVVDAQAARLEKHKSTKGKSA
jgi:recombination protein RecT